MGPANSRPRPDSAQGPRDRTKALHGPRTQAYGETRCKKLKITSAGQNLGLAWSSDSSLWGNQVQKVKNHKYWTEPRPCIVLGLKPMGKPSTKNFNYYKYWTEPRPCIVLGLKPMGKPSTKTLIITSVGQNQGLAWSSDSSLWGNQV